MLFVNTIQGVAMLERAHRHMAVALALGTAALVGACAGADTANEDTTAIGASSGALDTAGSSGSTTGEMSDAQIFGFTSLVDNAEVEAAQLAKEKGSNAQVKEYADMMIADHSKNAREAGELAQQLGVNPSDPASDEMKRAHEELMNKLNAASGMAFDTTYMSGMVMGHQSALQRLNEAMNATEEAQLREFLNTTRETVQKHLERAQQIQGQLVSGNR